MMCIGGDDIVQVFVLIGVWLKWVYGSYCVIDFEILLIEIFDWLCIDVMLCVLGFFCDVFLNLMYLFDVVVQVVVVFDEFEVLNLICVCIECEWGKWIVQGVVFDEVCWCVGWCVFGVWLGSYGVGLQDLIDQCCWQIDVDFVDVYC